MSDLRNQIIKAMDDAQEKFINTISTKYGISATELNELWKSGVTTSETKIQEKSPEVDSSTAAEDKNNYDKMKVKELKNLCKEKGLPVSGKKDDLIERLIKGPPKEAPKKQTVIKKTICEQLIEQRQTLTLRRNKWGNYEHPETGLVINKDRKVFGRQKDTGDLEPITSDIIELCKEHNLSYVLPENLNTQTVSIDDINLNYEDEDDDEDEDEDNDNILSDDDIEDEIEEDDNDDDIDEFFE